MVQTYKYTGLKLIDHSLLHLLHMCDTYCLCTKIPTECMSQVRSPLYIFHSQGLHCMYFTAQVSTVYISPPKETVPPFHQAIPLCPSRHFVSIVELLVSCAQQRQNSNKTPSPSLPSLHLFASSIWQWRWGKLSREPVKCSPIMSDISN